jgi:hypothetical protein
MAQNLNENLIIISMESFQRTEMEISVILNVIEDL